MYTCFILGFKLVIAEDVKDLMKEFTSSKLAEIHTKLEEQNELLGKMPTKDEIQPMLLKVSKLLEEVPTRKECNERLDTLEELIRDVTENVPERK